MSAYLLLMGLVHKLTLSFKGLNNTKSTLLQHSGAAIMGLKPELSMAVGLSLRRQIMIDFRGELSIFETSVYFYETTRRCIPGGCHIHTRRMVSVV
jgi:hypothetical protein